MIPCFTDRGDTLSGFGYFNEMVYFLDHSHHTGGIFLDNGVVHFFETEGVKGALLDCGAVDAALDLFDFNLCHICMMGFISL